jgi:Intracellular proteinase inhibitor
MNSMKSRVFALLLSLFPLAAASAADATPAPTPKPSLLNRLLHPFGGPKPKSTETEIKGTHFKHLGLSMTVEPKVLKLSENHDFKATVTLVNRGSQLVQMEFPTSQRIEVIIKTTAGKLVEQWSEDQAFVNEPTLVTINPNERLEYVATMATRDLTVGESYIVEAFFPNYETMRTELPLVPTK